MRSLAGMGFELYHIEHFVEAAAIFSEMILLNPVDNQGVRDTLLACLFITYQNDLIDEVLKTYKGDDRTAFEYSRALLSFRKHGGNAASNRLMLKAISSNHYIPDYLIAMKAIPDVPEDLPAYITPGEEDDAVAYAYFHRLAWRCSYGAIEWLKDIFAKTKLAPLSEPNSKKRIVKIANDGTRQF